MDAEETVALVAAALAGDGGAMERLVKLLTPVIQARVARTLARRRWRGGYNLRQDVEDLTQEVLLKLLDHDKRVLRSWRRERGLSLENFVGLVAEFHTISFLRSGRRNPWKEEPVLSDQIDLPDEEPDSLQIVLAREQYELLVARLEAILSPFGWEMFKLLFVHELSVEEVMAVTGLSADAVYAWRSRLRRLARELMNELSGTPLPPRTPPQEAE